MKRSRDTDLTHELAHRCATTVFADLPVDVVEICRHALLDWLGVTIAGSADPLVGMLLDTLDASSGPATLVGSGRRARTLDAALINGSASHALDFDDVSVAFVGHVSVALLGAVLALAEQTRSSLADVMTAFVAGYETACRVSVAIGRQPYLTGFHQTGTVGVLGAAAACARLLDLDATKVAIALGIAASSAAGCRCNFGTMTKPLHAGTACQNGLFAALLASRGFTANPRAIEADQGFAAVMGGSCNTELALAPAPSSWYVRDNLFKYHASCFLTHSMLEGVKELLASTAVDPTRIDAVHIHVGDLELGTCAIPAPTTALGVKFSLSHLAAMVLAGSSTASITDADATDRQLVALREKVVLHDDGIPGTPTRVVIVQGGRTYEACRDVNQPERDLDLQHRRLGAKFDVLAVPVLGDQVSHQLRTAVSELPTSSPVSTIMQLTHR